MAKKTELSIRITRIRKVFCNGDNREFAKELGLSEQVASSICTGNKPAGEGTLNKILKAFPRVNKVWLFLGEGEMLRPEPSISSEQIKNAAIGNNVSGDIVVRNEDQSDKTDIYRLIRLLENKDRQIDRLISLLENESAKQ
jgi:transcriptional regulator with XRE-family HTH domain